MRALTRAVAAGRLGPSDAAAAIRVRVRVRCLLKRRFSRASRLRLRLRDAALALWCARSKLLVWAQACVERTRVFLDDKADDFFGLDALVLDYDYEDPFTPVRRWKTLRAATAVVRNV